MSERYLFDLKLGDTPPARKAESPKVYRSGRRCTRCGVFFPAEAVEAMFRKSGRYRRRVCKMCNQTWWDEAKQLRRALGRLRGVRHPQATIQVELYGGGVCELRYARGKRHEGKVAP